MADSQTTIIISAKDEASGVIRKLEGNFGDLAGTLTKVAGAVGAAAAVTAGAKWLADITKQSIEAADKLGELAQSTGVAGSVLSQYSLAAKNSGTNVEGLAGGLQKLNIKIDDAANGGKSASETFARLGISVRDSGGELRTTDQIMLEVADKFADMEDGAAKTAIAVDLFGKAGANLIPFLNQGRDGLEEAADVADKLGIKLKDSTIAAADKTADSLGLVAAMAGGLGNKIMAEVLPTILSLTEKFTKFVVETGALDVAAKLVAGAFMVMVNAGQVVGAVFELIINNVSTAAKAVMLVAKGEFSQAWDTVKDGVSKAGEIVKSTGASIVETWTKTTDDVVGSDAKNKKSKEEVSGATAKVKDETDKAAKAFQDYIRSSEEKLANAESELEAGRKLTEVEKERNDILAKLKSGVMAASSAEVSAALALLDKRQAAAEALKADEDYRKSIEETKKTLDARLATEEKAVDTLRQSIEKQEEENLKIGMTKEQLADLEIAKLRDIQASKARNAEIIAGIPGREAEADTLREQVALYDDLIARKTEGRAAASMNDAAIEARKAAEKTAEEWKKTSDAIENSLTDALLRGFESGKNVFENLVETAKNLFKTLVLRPVIQAVVSPISQGITGMMGFSGSAAAASGVPGSSGMLSGISNLLGMGSSGLAGGFGGMASAFVSGGSLTAAEAAAAAAAYGEAGMTGIAASLEVGSALGPLAAAAPYIAAAVALYSMFSGPGGAPKSGGQSILDLTGGQVSTSALQTTAASDGGRLLYTPSDSDAKTYGLASAAIGQIRALAGSFGGSAGNLTLGLGFDTDPGGTASNRLSSFLARNGALQYSTTNRDLGRDDGALQSGLADEMSRLVLAGLASSNLPGKIGEYFASIDLTAVTGDQARAAVEAASTARTMAEAVRDLGGVFSTFSGLTVEARGSIVALTGGLEAFTSKTASFLQNYYSAEEQAGVAAAQVLRSLGAAGVDFGSLTDKGAVRTFLDSLDVSTTVGQQQFAAVLNASTTIASLAPFLEETGMSLGAVAALAPGGGTYEVLTGSAESAAATADYAASQVQLLTSVVDVLTQAQVDARTAAALAQGALDRIVVATEAGATSAWTASMAPSSIYVNGLQEG